ncbi:MAG: hypothetical protein SWY16_01635 [Cyanobacteriota bacterium]|nr:hypothetical protein [Cyanobacteriota bacterium]
MSSKQKTDIQKSSIAKQIYFFLGGSALGACLVFIPFSISHVELNSVRVVLASVAVFSCGALSTVWGEKFISSLMKGLESTGLY